ncbi:MAG: hypothetical protein WBA37_06225 [Xanthobacteraceae bacterium]
MRELDLPQATTGFSLRRMLDPGGSANANLPSDELFALSVMLPVRQAIDRDIDAYAVRHRTELSDQSRDADNRNDLQLFDRDLLYSARTHFALAGIVNRMDRAFVSPQTCGEIRLIYRLVRTEPRADEPVRLPMTLNVVLAAANPTDTATSRDTACAEVARRWLAMQDEASTGAALVRRLTEADGPLSLLQPSQLIRIELNLQVGHQPKSETQAFRTDYLMKVFRYDRAAQKFDEAPLENQIDRDRILADADVKAEFREWLLQPEHLSALDHGTLLVPEKFLARSAIASTPVGFVKSNMQPEFGLVQSSNMDKQAAFRVRDVVAALKRAVGSGVVFANIRSVAGFERRLNDITCAGCHQTRGIGGFHFPGADWMSPAPTTVVNVPASPHFIGDQPRRRDILRAFRDGRAPDFSRGFSSRPQLRGDTALLGTEYYDGWGAHCYDTRGRGSADRSFQSWTCAKGLSCQVIGGADHLERMGMCFVSSSAGEHGDERRRAGLKTTRPTDRAK